MSDDDNANHDVPWYLSGLAMAGASWCTHPLDLIKVALQTQQSKRSIMEFIRQVVEQQGVFTFYKGLTADVMRQMTYTLTRFGIYEIGMDFISLDTFLGKITLASLAGVCGGFVGTPADKVNVRMLYDVTLPPERRRNYKNGMAGLMKAYRHEGFKRLFSGATTASSRGLLMNVGQIAFYDEIKSMLLDTPHFQDNSITHFTAALAAGAIATTLTQPLDVLKTRAMISRPGEFSGPWDIMKFTARQGPLAFFKGYIPQFVRVCSNTIITFLILEEMRLHYGELPNVKPQ